MRQKILLVLLLMLCIFVPVQAQDLSGDESGTAMGQTAVTARIEMPETDEDGSDGDSAEDEVQTGDSSRPFVYVTAGCLCVVLIAAAVQWKRALQEK